MCSEICFFVKIPPSFFSRFSNIDSLAPSTCSNVISFKSFVKKPCAFFTALWLSVLLWTKFRNLNGFFSPASKFFAFLTKVRFNCNFLIVAHAEAAKPDYISFRVLTIQIFPTFECKSRRFSSPWLSSQTMLNKHREAHTSRDAAEGQSLRVNFLFEDHWSAIRHTELMGPCTRLCSSAWRTGSWSVDRASIVRLKVNRLANAWKCHWAHILTTEGPHRRRKTWAETTVVANSFWTSRLSQSSRGCWWRRSDDETARVSTFLGTPKRICLSRWRPLRWNKTQN